MKTLLAAVLLLWCAAPLAAEPAITSISPNAGPLEGGTRVTIKGSGFTSCAPSCPPLTQPTLVFFGGVGTGEVTLVDSNTLVAVAPPHLPKTVDIAVIQNDGRAELQNAYTYSGDVDAAFERILLPSFISHIDGAFGSRFLSDLQIRPAKTAGTRIFGIRSCHPIHFTPGCGPDDDLSEFPFTVVDNARSPEWRYEGTPGRFVYIPRNDPAVVMNFRAYDVSRDAHNFGVEIPVVRGREMRTDPIRFLGVPTDPRFRSTLRIYATAATIVEVRYGTTEHFLSLEPGENLFEPAYAQFTRFPVGADTIDVTVELIEALPPLPGFPPPPPIWAFLTVTNNDTQAITTITPQR
jgi:IPT/TIG domain